MSERKDFDRFGFSYMPCTIAGWLYLCGFVSATIAAVFLGRFVWTAWGLPGVDFVGGAILLIGIIALTRFAHRRSE
ncbi:MAG: hypothetical protein CL955_03455 [Erythrobacteraceae bacterium]|nr:hypothetical protein [Erythrobacteraceae bacterium]